MKVKDINNRNDLQFVSDSQDVAQIKEDFGNNEDVSQYDSFFVKTEDGDYVEVYGMEGIVPNLEKHIWLVNV